MSEEEKTTRLNIRQDRPTAIASSAHGSNVDVLGFNITFLAARNPKLAVELMKLYAQARQVKADDPLAPDEDLSYLQVKYSKICRTRRTSSKIFCHRFVPKQGDSFRHAYICYNCFIVPSTYKIKGM